MRPSPQRILFFSAAGVFMISLMFPHIAAAAATSTPNAGAIDALRIFGTDMGLPSTDPRLIVARLIRAATGFIGIIMLLMILSSGAQFMGSGGDEEKVKKAKQTFYNAVIGLIIMLSSYSIVAFVLNSLSTATSSAPLQ